MNNTDNEILLLKNNTKEVIKRINELDLNIQNELDNILKQLDTTKQLLSFNFLIPDEFRSQDINKSMENYRIFLEKNSVFILNEYQLKLKKISFRFYYYLIKELEIKPCLIKKNKFQLMSNSHVIHTFYQPPLSFNKKIDQLTKTIKEGYNEYLVALNNQKENIKKHFINQINKISEIKKQELLNNK